MAVARAPGSDTFWGMNPGWFGILHQYKHASLAAAVCALHAAACGGNTYAGPPPPDAAAGSGAQSGSAGAGGSSGGGLANPRCGTRDDGAQVLADDLEGVGLGYARLDATHLYYPFHEERQPGVFTTRIYKVGLHAGAPLEELATREGTVGGFVLTEQHVWWPQHPPLAVGPSETTLFRVRKAGGHAEVMIRGYIQNIASSPQGLVILRMNEELRGDSGTFQLLPWSGGVPTDLCQYEGLHQVAANATLVAWIDEQGIETCPLTGGPPSLVHVLDRSEVAVALAVDSTHAYWSSFQSGIHRVPLAGGQRETIAVHPNPNSPANPLVLDGDEIFFLADAYRIQRVPKTGGRPRDAIAPQTGIMFFTIDATHIYWGEGYPIVCLKRMLK